MIHIGAPSMVIILCAMSRGRSFIIVIQDEDENAPEGWLLVPTRARESVLCQKKQEAVLMCPDEWF